MKLVKSLQSALGLHEVSDDLIATCAARVKLRCSRVDLTLHRRAEGQAVLESEACAAIVGAFRDFHPKAAHKFMHGPRWPVAHAIIRGNRAFIEIWYGIEYEGADESEQVIELVVDRHPKQISIVEKVEDFLLNRRPRAADKVKPTLDLISTAPVARKEPAPTGQPEPRTAQSRPTAPARPAVKPTPVKPTPRKP